MPPKHIKNIHNTYSSPTDEDEPKKANNTASTFPTTLPSESKSKMNFPSSSDSLVICDAPLAMLASEFYKDIFAISVKIKILKIYVCKGFKAKQFEPIFITHQSCKLSAAFLGTHIISTTPLTNTIV